MARLTAAFVEGARAGGLLTTAKHFPGPRRHRRSTATCSSPTVGADRQRLEAVELLPFRARRGGGRGRGDARPHRGPGARSLRRAGHAVRADERRAAAARARLRRPGRDRRHGDGGRARGLDGGGGGARGAGRRRLHPAAAATPRWPSRRWCARCARASSREARLDESVLRILEAKERLGLHEQPPGGPRRRLRAAWPGPRTWSGRWRWRAARSPSCATRAACCRCAPSSRCGCCTSCCRATPATTRIQGIPEEELQARRVPARDRERSAPRSRTRRRPASWPRAARVHATCWPRASCACPAPRARRTCRESHARLLRALRARGRAADRGVVRQPVPAAAVPRRCPSTCAPTAPRSPASGPRWAALFGEYAVAGRLPVTLPGLYPYGHGLELPRHDMTLRVARPEEVGFRDGRPGGRRPRGGAGGGASGPSRAPCSRWARTARSSTCGPSAGSPTTRTRPRSRTGHDLRPRQPDQGRGHDDDGHDPGGRGAARPRQARLRVPAELPRRRARTRSRSGTC